MRVKTTPEIQIVRMNTGMITPEMNGVIPARSVWISKPQHRRSNAKYLAGQADSSSTVRDSNPGANLKVKVVTFGEQYFGVVYLGNRSSREIAKEEVTD
jgi:hypothetical protein